MDFTTMDIATVTRSVTGSGERYLELFLKEYTSIFKEKVNPSCPKCLTEYLNRYKNHFNAMANTCKYRLNAKYENIPLEFGSPILVNNGNITDEYAQKLLAHNNGQRYFSQMPKTLKNKKQKPPNPQRGNNTEVNNISVNEAAE
ncbi:hypothetical protein [Flavobacterium suzhouense]|uniref:Uncharacterized protein n=1 Tax=Flavobacterium suzhouense TaxID=1529638 RepID=A0ABW5NPL5_9FLAO